jgi:hypothetical protein
LNITDPDLEHIKLNIDQQEVQWKSDIARLEEQAAKSKRKIATLEKKIKNMSQTISNLPHHCHLCVVENDIAALLGYLEQAANSKLALQFVDLCRALFDLVLVVMRNSLKALVSCFVLAMAVHIIWELVKCLYCWIYI